MAIEDLLQSFRNHLTATGKSPHTLGAYVRDLSLFARWFEATNGKELSPEAITPIDIRQYRSHLLTVQGHKPATVNRKLASLSAFCTWAQEEGTIPANPAQGIAPVEEVRPAPRWLDKRGRTRCCERSRRRGGRGTWP